MEKTVLFAKHDEAFDLAGNFTVRELNEIF